MLALMACILYSRTSQMPRTLITNAVHSKRWDPMWSAIAAWTAHLVCQMASMGPPCQQFLRCSLSSQRRKGSLLTKSMKWSITLTRTVGRIGRSTLPNFESSLISYHLQTKVRQLHQHHQHQPLTKIRHARFPHLTWKRMTVWRLSAAAKLEKSLEPKMDFGR